MKKYFLSFLFKNDLESHGFGNAILMGNYKIKDIESIRKAEKEIQKKFNVENVKLVFYKKI